MAFLKGAENEGPINGPVYRIPRRWGWGRLSSPGGRRGNLRCEGQRPGRDLLSGARIVSVLFGTEKERIAMKRFLMCLTVLAMTGSLCAQAKAPMSPPEKASATIDGKVI